MWRKSSTERPPWPVAPRPFADEPLGGWLGRVASAYRVTVAQLWSDAGLTGMLPQCCAGWLLIAGLRAEDRRRLAALARLDASVLEAIEPAAAWADNRTRLSYCFACLVLNPLDVMTPCWKREWLAPQAARCTVHDRALASVTAASLYHPQHFAQLYRSIMRHHRRAKIRKYGRDAYLLDWQTYSQH